MREAKRLTLPQIIMLNHAAQVNQARGEERYEAKKAAEEKNPVLENGKRTSAMSEDDWWEHYTGAMAGESQRFFE